LIIWIVPSKVGQSRGLSLGWLRQLGKCALDVAGRSDVHVHEQGHLPPPSVLSAAHDRRELPMKTLKTAGV